jgi:hypothetical protein
MIIVGSLIVIVFVFVLLFPADAVLISRTPLPYGLPCARRGCGDADFSMLGREGLSGLDVVIYSSPRCFGHFFTLSSKKGVVGVVIPQ